MFFELTEALIDDLLFCMEDQNGIFLLDTEDGLAVSEDEVEDDDEDRYIGIPEWDSAEGFHLMEQFAAGFKNAVVREALTESLNQGKGVFRAFKKALSRYPEAEKRWFSFKEREMRREIIRWYNALRESWNMEKIGEEPEETEDLVLEDFIFREYEAGDEDAVTVIHGMCVGNDPQSTAACLTIPPALGQPVLVAETAGRELAGFVAVSQEGDTLRISRIEVKPEYRGLGIGSELCSLLLEKARDSKANGVKHESPFNKSPIARIVIDLPAEAEGFSRVLFRASFKSIQTRYALNLEQIGQTDRGELSG
jgi:ribosomal protein S18 acetylase RimI-like enzyme